MTLNDLTSLIAAVAAVIAAFAATASWRQQVRATRRGKPVFELALDDRMDGWDRYHLSFQNHAPVTLDIVEIFVKPSNLELKCAGIVGQGRIAINQWAQPGEQEYLEFEVRESARTPRLKVTYAWRDNQRRRMSTKLITFSRAFTT
ncbi:hypothetical protein KUV28_17585 [Ferrimonas balearica]|nr:hypothetical protein [Ferrimonas balearica]